MRWSLQVPGGEIPVVADDEEGSSVLILAHGAGGHMDHRTVEWLAGIVRQAGFRVVRFNFLYRSQGRSLPDRMPVLMATYRAVIASVRERLAPANLVVGGHSMGGRVASMIQAEESSAQGLLLFGYPLHPPGKLDRLRDAHLASIGVPVLQINGTEDPLCSKELMEATRLPARWTLHWLDGADHGYALRRGSGRTRGDLANEILVAIREWTGACGLLGNSGPEAALSV